jgi:hypothetical protein
MAAIDTIEVLDNLQFTHADTADIYSVDAAGEAGEAVVTIPIALPMEASAARVIINNAYGATGSTVHARVRCTDVTGITATTVTKTQNTQPLEWTSVALGAMQESAEIDLTNIMGPLLHIDLALTGTTAHLGTEVRVQIRKEATVEEWTDWCRVVRLSGKTAIKNDIASEAASGQKVIATANPVAGNLDHVARNIFILDATVAQCEIVYQTAFGADT